MFTFGMLGVVIGILLWVVDFWIWLRSSGWSTVSKATMYLLLPVVYGLGFFAIVVGLGVDHWDDSSAWYWDTWLLLGSSAVIQSLYGASRFRGLARALTAIFPGFVMLAIVWWYRSIV
jgi:hypothetical protein